MEKKIKILILGTVLFNQNNQSRAFESYFSSSEKIQLAQFFSNSQITQTSNVSTFFQITDLMLLKKWLGDKSDCGITKNDFLKKNKLNKPSNNFVGFLYSLGKIKLPFFRILRKILWKKKFWNNKKFIQWVENFKPDLLFLSFSDDFFLNEIALFLANHFHIPILSSISDDYYFNERFSLDPFYFLYRFLYKSLINQILAKYPHAIFIGDLIKKIYTEKFHLVSETIFLSSSWSTLDFQPINIHKQILLIYFGNLNLGRLENLIKISSFLSKNKIDFQFDIYSGSISKREKSLMNKSNLTFCGFLSYQDLSYIIKKYDFIVITENFKNKHITNTKYSISTKVADSLKSGKSLFIYGPKEAGAINYLFSENIEFICTTPKIEFSNFEKYFTLQNQIDSFTRRYLLFSKNHSIEMNKQKMNEIISKVLTKYE
jgi:hypothetical protein